MVSEAKVAANRRNAQKSTGPKSEEGKQAVRFNALRHGLTASLAMLPDEDGNEFEVRLTDWVRVYRPRNAVERGQVERACYLSWQLLRVMRAQSAHLCHNAETRETDLAAHEARETIRLALELYLPGPQARWKGVEEGKPGEGTEKRGPAAESPALVESGLEAMGDGCRWLHGQWKEMQAILEAGRAWQAVDCFKVVRLLGMGVLSVVDLADLADLLRLCQSLAGGGAELAKETWDLLAPEGADRGWEALEALLQVADDDSRDAARARERVETIVQEQIDRLASKIEMFDDQQVLDRVLGPHLNAFDDSPLGEKMRRYERECERTIRRITSELENRSMDDITNHFHTAEREERKRGIEQLLNAQRAKREQELEGERKRKLERVCGTRQEEIDAELEAAMVIAAEQSARSDEARRNEATAERAARNEATGPVVARNEATGPVVARNEATGPVVARSEAIARPASRNEATGPVVARSEATAPPASRNEATGPVVARSEATADGGAGNANVAESSLIRDKPNGEGAGEPVLAKAPAGAAAPARADEVPVIHRHRVGCATVTRLAHAAQPAGGRHLSRRERRAQRRELARHSGAGR